MQGEKFYSVNQNLSTNIKKKLIMTDEEETN